MIKVMNREHLNATEQSQTKIFKSLTDARAHAKNVLMHMSMCIQSESMTVIFVKSLSAMEL